MFQGLEIFEVKRKGVKDGGIQTWLQAEAVSYASWVLQLSSFLWICKLTVQLIVKYMSMKVKIGEWNVKCQLNMIIVSWNMINDELKVEEWCGETSGREDET